MSTNSLNYGLVYHKGNIEAVRRVVDARANDRIVLDRIQKNVLGGVGAIGREELWREHIACLLTSQQKSNYDDPVPQFLRRDPFPLDYRGCQQASLNGKLNEHISGAFVGARGIRFLDEKIPKAISENIQRLEHNNGAGWELIVDRAKRLHKQIMQVPSDPDHYRVNCESDFPLENSSAELVDKLRGFGPKQSRNFWQSLGLTRFVSVLDSRIKKWCASNLGPRDAWEAFQLNNPRIYARMADALRELCLEAKVLPCIFDAAAFSTFSDEVYGPEYVAMCRGDLDDFDNTEETFQ